MRITALALLLTACSALPPNGSLERMKYDSRSDLVRQCVGDPQQFGFPYSRAQNSELLTIAPQRSLNVDSYCRKVVWHLVR